MPKKVLVVGNFPTESLTGHQVQTASGYDEAIEALKKRKFDIIIMDAVIDATRGLRFLNYVRSKIKTPTIVRYAEDVASSPAAGCDWIIPNFVRTYCKFAILSQIGKGELARTRRLMEDMLQRQAA